MLVLLCMIGCLFCMGLGLVFRKLHKENTWLNGDRIENNKQAVILSVLSLASYSTAVALLLLATKV